MYELCQKCLSVATIGRAMLLQFLDFYGETFHVDCKYFQVCASPRDHGGPGTGHTRLHRDGNERVGA
jgi:hypothetical protein